MNLRRHIRTIALGFCAPVLLCAAAGVSAQAIYKNVDTAGNIAYTDRSDALPSSQNATVPDLDAPKAPARITRISSRHAALIDANEAARRLRQAQLKRKQGVEPMAGENVHGSGASTLNHRYWRRQEKLRHAVENAQRRSGQTSRPAPRAPQEIRTASSLGIAVARSGETPQDQAQQRQ
jgi:hypothetical protein